MRIPPTYLDKVAAYDPSLSYQEQDPDGKVRTFFEPHPAGSRKIRRRMRQRHYPRFTKRMTRGSEWNPRNTPKE